MSEILTPDNVIELAKLFSVAIGTAYAAKVAISTMERRASDALQKQYDVTLKAFETNNKISDAINNLRVAIEKLCTMIGGKP